MTDGGTLPPVGTAGAAATFGAFTGADDFFLSTCAAVFFGGLLGRSSSVDDKLLLDTFSSGVFVVAAFVGIVLSWLLLVETFSADSKNKSANASQLTLCI